ncbi:MAG: clan AA aspartic protease [Candidatus Kapabacteria bacterium]|nr:clan AA aspartic protease [Candidatus Kapabacteria bacterium]
MGLINATIELINSYDLISYKKGLINKDEIKRITVEALVDTGAYMLCINENTLHQLGLEIIDKRPAVLADGSIKDLDIAGPIEIHFQNRRTITQALVLPGDTQILLGSIPMEDMDVIIEPKQQKIMVNPLSPNFATTILK